MILKENTKFSYALAIVLLIVGVVCYAAGEPARLPDEPPVRKVFMGVAGNVLFDHQGHTDYEGDCTVCHHHGEEASFRACDTCHLSALPKKEPAICAECHPLSKDEHVKDVHYEHHVLMENEPDTWTCKKCHELAEGETIPAACGDCHDPEEVEGQAKIMTYQKSVDAMHAQCIDCHEEMGSGPTACEACHAQ
ncbi:MAG: cytochrome c3 family protein [Thermodesulfobacteriota bacterium]